MKKVDWIMLRNVLLFAFFALAVLSLINRMMNWFWDVLTYAAETFLATL